ITALSFGCRANLGEKFLGQCFVRVNLGVLSIYQPRNCQGQAVSSGFVGFYTRFLEKDSTADASESYIQGIDQQICRYDVVFILSVRRLQHRITKVLQTLLRYLDTRKVEKCGNLSSTYGCYGLQTPATCGDPGTKDSVSTVKAG